LLGKKKAIAMSNSRLSFRSSHEAQGATLLEGFRRLDTARRDVTPTSVDDFGLLAAADRDQLERDIAAIERATAALRSAEPALQSWTNSPATTLHKPRPVWLLIGVLWLSTALATLGAVFAISALVG
jgi:hypothetical protein